MHEIYINGLIDYGIQNNLIESADVIYIRNRLLETLGLFTYSKDKEEQINLSFEDILEKLIDIAYENNVIENTASARERFSDLIMDILTPRPSEVKNVFNEKYKVSPRDATDYFYNLCKACNYIKTYRIERDIKWNVPTEYGEFEITINLSKPEKDPKDIAAARLAPKTNNYPECLLCLENEGYSGTIHHPSRQNHRIIPLDLSGEDWGLQYSPYLYYNEHCIVINKNHRPMTVDKMTFKRLVAFLDKFPHYFIGSNADLPIVGGSILSHEHFQGGRHTFPLENAVVEKEFHSKLFPDIEIGIVKWPMSVIRARSDNSASLAEFSSHVLEKWRCYSDESAGIYAFSGDIPHNTITPITRIKNGKYEFDLVLRNNITTNEHPIGVFHPHKELHNIKKENIGLIEVMGLAILPPRLLQEIELLKEALINNADIKNIPEITHHAEWVALWKSKYNLNINSIDSIIKNEIGNIFLQVLCHSGVYKRDEAGQKAFVNFIETVIS